MNDTRGNGSVPITQTPASDLSPKVIRVISRPDAERVGALRALGVATVHEAQGRRGLLRPYVRPTLPNMSIAGPCVTVLCPPGDNLMIHASIEVCQPGDVLVVATTSESSDGMFGDLLGVLCQSRGVAGLIIDAGVRDTAELAAMQFPVWARAICAQGTVKASAGSVNVPIVCAGVVVNPGDIAVAGPDGVVVVPLAAAEEILALGQQRIKKEEEARQRFRNGELSLDVFGLRAKLRELGVQYPAEDCPERP